MKKRYLTVDAHLSEEPEIGRWLWALQDARQRTLRELDGVSQAAIDWRQPGNESGIGTILYHIAVIEADWLYVEVLEQPMPPEVIALFSFSPRDEMGRLTQVREVSLDEHLARLKTVRGLLFEAFQQMDLPDFRRVRRLENYDVTPEWVLHHLMQHEAEHRSQMGWLRAGAESGLG